MKKLSVKKPDSSVMHSPSVRPQEYAADKSKSLAQETPVPHKCRKTQQKSHELHNIPIAIGIQQIDSITQARQFSNSKASSVRQQDFCRTFSLAVFSFGYFSLDKQRKVTGSRWKHNMKKHNKTQQTENSNIGYQSLTKPQKQNHENHNKTQQITPLPQNDNPIRNHA